ncbi:MAG TPA: NAD(P)H-dependent oxidoreductase, partial [Thermomicrobiales bacterium]|nr:NAD(P)H-dependent oxidoreductase [Thermomicrobiales bacterium]
MMIDDTNLLERTPIQVSHMPREIRIVAVSGAISNPSKTTALVRTIAEHAVGCLGGESSVFDIAGLQPEIGQSLVAGELTPTLRCAVSAIEQADLLIAASPVFNGGYSGLFKHLFDLVDPRALRGTPTILGATGGT